MNKHRYLLIALFYWFSNYSSLSCMDLIRAITHNEHEKLNDISFFNSHADPKFQDKNGDSILMHAVRNGHAFLVKQLLKLNTEVNLQNKNKKTALILAINHGHIEIAKILIVAGADINIADSDGNSAKSILPEKHEIIEFYQAFHKKRIAKDEVQRIKNIYNNIKETLLKLAEEKKYKEIAEILKTSHEWLVNHGFIQEINNFICSLLKKILETESEEKFIATIKLIDINLYVHKKIQYKLFFLAIFNNKLEIIKYLIKELHFHEFLLIPNIDNLTPCMYATKLDRKEIVDYLTVAESISLSQNPANELEDVEMYLNV